MPKLIRRLAVLSAAAFLVMGWTGAANAQDKTYVLIAAAAGDSTDSAHLNWIDAYGLDTSVERIVSGGGGGAGAPQFQEVSILKGTDKATPLLHDIIARGVIMPLVTVDVCRQGPQQCYYKVELTNAQLVGLDVSGSSCVGTGACTPAQTESLSLVYTRIKWTFTPFAGGTPGTPVTRCFDVVSGSAC